VEAEAALGVVTSRFFVAPRLGYHGRLAREASSLVPRHMPRTKTINPFYVLLVLLGIAFSITACAYGVMAFKAVHAGRQGADDAPPADAAGSGLLEFMDKHGARLMAAELALLGLATVAAMATDRYWFRQSQRGRRSGKPNDQHGEPGS